MGLIVFKTRLSDMIKFVDKKSKENIFVSMVMTLLITTSNSHLTIFWKYCGHDEKGKEF